MHRHISPLNRKILIDIITMLIVGLVGVVGYKLSPLLSSTTDIRIAPPATCNLHRATCVVEIEGGRLELSLSPKPVPLIRPITIEVRTVGLAIRRIDADFTGLDMNMGYNRPQLLPIDASLPAGEALFRSETNLPVCITDSMNWELSLLVETKTGSFLIPFRFTTPETATAISQRTSTP
jgi:hypothetical protein